MDHNLTKQIRAWLDTPEEQRDLAEGALLVLRLSNNRIMYQGFQRNLKRSAKMIAYQLQKYYNFRVQDLTHQEVAEMAAEVKKIVEKDNLQAIPPVAASSESVGESPSAELIAAIRKGKRPDHDALPEDIQALYTENLSILQRMRNLHAKLELLSVENSTCPDSERYPFLKELIALDKKYHENWHTYDHFVLSGDSTSPVVPTEEEKDAEAAPANDADATPVDEQPAASPAKSKKTTRKTTTRKSTKKKADA